jgi:hypothetical protein
MSPGNAQFKSSTSFFQRRSLSNKDHEMATSTFPTKDADLPSYEEVSGAIDLRSTGSLRSKAQSQLSYEISNLGILFDCARRRRQEELDQDDENILDILLLHIKNFLNEFSRTTFRKAAFIIIPCNAVDPLASPCDEDLQSTEEYCRLLRLAPAEKKETIWEDRGKVERLASYLQPEDKTNSENTTTQYLRPLLQSKSSASARRSFFKKESKPRNHKSEEPSSSLLGSEKMMPSSNVSMTVKGEEVVFRLENSLGLYETQSAWGLIVKVRVAT